MTLHTPNRNSGSSRYCGPTAIMTVTGRLGSEVRDAVRQARGDIRDAAGAHMPVMGMSNKDLLAAMEILGWAVAEQWEAPDQKLKLVPDPNGKWHAGDGTRKSFRRPPGFKPLLFSDFLRSHGAGGPYIVNVTGHYMAVSAGEVCDAYENQLPRDIEKYLTTGKRKYRNSWVWKWWKFERAEQ